MTKYALLRENGRLESATVEEYTDIQELVGGLFCAPWEGPRLDGKASVFANDEGILLGMELNVNASLILCQNIVGPVLIGGPVDDEGEVTDITDEVKSMLLRWTGQPLT